MTWLPGDPLTVRGRSFRVLRHTPYHDCALLDLSTDPPGHTTSLLLPFDRPRPRPRPLTSVVSRRKWAHEVSQLLATSHPFGGLRYCPPAIRLLPYQLEPALATLRHGALRLLVADDVGLGKTVEAGLVVREVAMAAPLSRTLIVCPASVGGQWARELESLFGLRAHVADAAWLRQAARELPPDLNPWSVPGIHLASMDFIKRPEALYSLEQIRWDLVVVDEAHAATRTSHRYAAIHALACRARRVMLLTATPHSGKDKEFEALCRMGAGRNAPPLVVFSRSRADTPLAPGTARSRVLAVRPSEAESRMHRGLEAYTARIWAESKHRHDRSGELVATLLRKRALSSPFTLALSLRRRLQILSRTSEPPAAQLPLPYQEEDEIEDQAPDATLSAMGLDDEGEEREVLGKVLCAAEEASTRESKAAALERLLRRIGEPAIVFSEYRDTAERLWQQLADAGHRVRLLHGGMTPRERAGAVAAFNAGGVVLVATDAASEGLNLQHACRVVVHFELPWTPSRLHQRCGRVNRIGQRRRVHEIALVAAHTAEQTVLAPLLRRAGRAKPFVRTALASRLTELQVAARVVGGAPLEPDVEPASTPAVNAMDLREEACREAERLELIRRLEPGARPGGAPGRSGLGRAGLPAGAVVAVARGRQRTPAPGPRPGSIRLAVVVSLRDHDGSVVDRTVVWVEVGMPGVVWPRRHALLRAEVMARIQHLDPLLHPVVVDAVSERLAAARAWHGAVVGAVVRREAEMRARLPSTARQLVQAGLFDRRALRAAAAQAAAADVLEEDWAAQVPDAKRARATAATCEVAAVLLGGWR